MQETRVWSLDLEDALEEEISVYLSILILVWRTPWTEEPGGLQSKGLERVRHDWATEENSIRYNLLSSIVFCHPIYKGYSIRADIFVFWVCDQILVLEDYIGAWCTSSVQFSRSVVSYSLRPHELKHARPPCPSPTLEFTLIHVHWVGDAIQPSHPLSSPSPPAPNPYQHQCWLIFQWVKTSHEAAKVLEFQL